MASPVSSGWPELRFEEYPDIWTKLPYPESDRYVGMPHSGPAEMFCP